MADREILFTYDAECPICDLYCGWGRIRPSVGELKRVNARESTAVMEDITRAGLDIDQGMVLQMGGTRYNGSMPSTHSL